MDVNKLKVPELRKELKNRGLSTVGNKNELLERLQAAMKDSKVDDNDAASVDLEEDLLNEDDDESHIEENDSDLLDATLDKSPAESSDSSPLKRKSDGTAANGTTTAKKIVLTRTQITMDKPAAITETDDAASKKQADTATEEGEKKVIKLSELSAKERLEMRAKKFGQPLSGDAKKLARAERFGSSTTTATTTKTASVPISNSAPASADVLKQRAERFGVNVSTTLTKLENQERLEKRKARFGATTTTATAENGSSAAAKAQARLERFKQQSV